MKQTGHVDSSKRIICTNCLYNRISKENDTWYCKLDIKGILDESRTCSCPFYRNADLVSRNKRLQRTISKESKYMIDKFRSDPYQFVLFFCQGKRPFRLYEKKILKILLNKSQK